MSDKFPLQTLLDLSNMRLDDAAKKLGQLIASEQAASERLKLLSDYRDEYHTRFLTAAKNGLSPDEWQNYRAFLDKLDDAIGQARDMLTQSQSSTQKGQAEWLDQRGKVKAYDTLAQRHETRLQYGEARQEQKRSDEHAARGRQQQGQQDN